MDKYHNIIKKFEMEKYNNLKKINNLEYKIDLLNKGRFIDILEKFSTFLILAYGGLFLFTPLFIEKISMIYLILFFSSVLTIGSVSFKICYLNKLKSEMKIEGLNNKNNGIDNYVEILRLKMEKGKYEIRDDVIEKSIEICNIKNNNLQLWPSYKKEDNDLVKLNDNRELINKELDKKSKRLSLLKILLNKKPRIRIEEFFQFFEVSLIGTIFSGIPFALASVNLISVLCISSFVGILFGMYSYYNYNKDIKNKKIALDNISSEYGIDISNLDNIEREYNIILEEIMKLSYNISYDNVVLEEIKLLEDSQKEEYLKIDNNSYKVTNDKTSIKKKKLVKE